MCVCREGKKQRVSKNSGGILMRKSTGVWGGVEIQEGQVMDSLGHRVTCGLCRAQWLVRFTRNLPIQACV